MAVRQEKNKKKWTKDGKCWYYDIYYKNEYGERKEIKSRLFKLKKEAEQAQRDKLNELNDSKYNDQNISFNDAFNDWLNYRSKRIKVTTNYGDEKRVNRHILDFFNGYNLHSINISTINKWLDYMNTKGLKLTYINQIIRLFKDMLNFCVDYYNFDKKIAMYLQPYKAETSDKVRDSRWNFWTYNDFDKFINVVDNEYHYLIFNFMYFTGMRLGEVIALKWKDIDLNKKTVNIEKTFTTKVKGKAWDLLDPKTKNSIRIIDIDDELVKLLKNHYEREKKIYDFNDEMFVFGNVKHLGESTLRRWLNNYIELSNVKTITPHGFRHSHVSFLINLGADSRDVAERIGDTVQVVEETYYHMFPEKKSITVSMINSFKKS